MRSRHTGGALLAVLWLSAALSAIAFSVATTVRGETERAATTADGVRAYFLAAGAIARAILYVQWGPFYRNPDGTTRYYENGMPFLRLSFPAGEAIVEVIPETSKLNLNSGRPADLWRLLAALGVEPGRAQEIVTGIVDWRTPLPAGALTMFDQHYLSLVPSFRARHASFEETEEVLLVRGMTPEIYYGGYGRDAQGRLWARSGFRDCVSVYGAVDRFDVNSADPALLVAAGVPAEIVPRIVEQRRVAPFTAQQLAAFGQGLPGFNHLSAGGNPLGGNVIYTLRATARPRAANGQLSDLRRTVSALVKFYWERGYQEPYRALRWYDTETSGNILR